MRRSRLHGSNYSVLPAWSLPLILSLMLSPFLIASSAWSYGVPIAEDYMRMPTDGAATHLFPSNPTTHEFNPLEGGALMIRASRDIELNQDDSNGDTLRTSGQNNILAVGTMADLGAGAAIGFSHQILFHETENETSANPGNNRTEVLKQSYSAIKLMVELTSEVKAGMVMRYLYQDRNLLGDYFISDGGSTAYKSTLVGYGAGGQVRFGKGGLQYAYLPPLRGKSEVLGEEKIVVESGQIVADAWFEINAKTVAGISVKRWLHELDDRASGTTANDQNQTNISLHGLDLEQYLFPYQSILLGADYELSGQSLLRVGLGRKTSDFNVRDLATFNRFQVRQGFNQEARMNETVISLMLKFTNKNLNFHVGGRFLSGEHEFSSAMNGGKYSVSGRDLILSVSSSL